MTAYERDDDSPFAGEIELDESYFGGHRKANRGRGAAGKIPVFGLLNGGRDLTEWIYATERSYYSSPAALRSSSMIAFFFAPSIWGSVA